MKYLLVALTMLVLLWECGHPDDSDPEDPLPADPSTSPGPEATPEPSPGAPAGDSCYGDTHAIVITDTAGPGNVVKDNVCEED